MRARLAAAVAGTALALGCGAEPAGTAEPTPALRIDADPVEVAPGRLNGLRLVDAVVLKSGHPQVGGFSGLLVGDGRLTAVTDQGWLLEADLAPGDAVGLGPAEFAPLPGSGAGRKWASDSESLARSEGRLAIGFERDHRIELIDGARIADEIRDRAFERLASNQGLEALASLPDGRLLAVAEAPVDGAFPAFVIGPDGRDAAGLLPRAGRHYVTGADVGPDGRLYLVRRDWSILVGLSARIERYWLGKDGIPRPETREVLAEFESASGIDNMEGIALWRDPDGATRLAVISDDNFNPIQRTLLLLFDVLQ